VQPTGREVSVYGGPMRNSPLSRPGSPLLPQRAVQVPSQSQSVAPQKGRDGSAA
jgi:hypothetical protein